MTEAQMTAKGVFNGFADIDSEFYLDPRLLAKTKVPEFRGAHKHFKQHFRKVFTLAALFDNKKSPTAKNLLRNAITAKLTTPEITGSGLGYGSRSKDGNGIGSILAAQIADTAFAILELGISNPEVFELLGLFQEGVGSDRISDMMVWVVMPFVRDYNKRIAKVLDLKTKKARIGTVTDHFPYDLSTERPILLLPRTLLSDLPVAKSFRSIGVVASANQALRDSLNATLGKDWEVHWRKMRKADLRQYLFDNPDVFKSLVKEYGVSTTAHYDFDVDPDNAFRWDILIRDAVARHALDLTAFATPSRPHLTDAVRLLCEHFKDLVENRGAFELLHDLKRRPVRERRIQTIFRTMCSLYCDQNKIDMSPEANAGVGPVDFKFTNGGLGPVLVEVKKSNNSKLARGYKVQLKTYVKANKALHSYYLIVKFKEKVTQLDEVLKLEVNYKAAKATYAPDVVVVDGRWQKSASKQ